mmetsp:Transcript_258/g.954  ORF Transcript_258/g.954 Transcript_258/m.954 type:complete len:273 (-) Transcript_258:151-969(-)
MQENPPLTALSKLPCNRRSEALGLLLFFACLLPRQRPSHGRPHPAVRAERDRVRPRGAAGCFLCVRVEGVGGGYWVLSAVVFGGPLRRVLREAARADVDLRDDPGYGDRPRGDGGPADDSGGLVSSVGAGLRGVAGTRLGQPLVPHVFHGHRWRRRPPQERRRSEEAQLHSAHLLQKLPPLRLPLRQRRTHLRRTVRFEVSARLQVLPRRPPLLPLPLPLPPRLHRQAGRQPRTARLRRQRPRTTRYSAASTPEPSGGGTRRKRGPGEAAED